MPDKIVLWLILFFTLHTQALAQEPSFVQLQREPEFTLAPDKAHIITLSFIVKEGYHIQANQVKDEYLIPSALTIEASPAWIVGDPVFPESTEFRMQGAAATLQVYSNILEISVPISVDKPMKRGLYNLKGKLHYQACDHSKCYFPRDLNFVMKINIPYSQMN